MSQRIQVGAETVIGNGEIGRHFQLRLDPPPGHGEAPLAIVNPTHAPRGIQQDGDMGGLIVPDLFDPLRVKEAEDNDGKGKDPQGEQAGSQAAVDAAARRVIAPGEQGGESRDSHPPPEHAGFVSKFDHENGLAGPPLRRAAVPS